MDFNLFRQKPYSRYLSYVFCLFAIIATFFTFANFHLAKSYTTPENIAGANLYGFRWAGVAFVCVLSAILSMPVLDWILLKAKTRLVRIVELRGHSISHNLDRFGKDTVTVEFKVGEQSFTLAFEDRSFDGNIALDENYYFLFELRFNRNHRLIGAKCLENSI